MLVWTSESSSVWRSFCLVSRQHGAIVHSQSPVSNCPKLGNLPIIPRRFSSKPSSFSEILPICDSEHSVRFFKFCCWDQTDPGLQTSQSVHVWGRWLICLSLSFLGNRRRVVKLLPGSHSPRPLSIHTFAHNCPCRKGIYVAIPCCSSWDFFELWTSWSFVNHFQNKLSSNYSNLVIHCSILAF